jgi:hypothetical protein
MMEKRHLESVSITNPHHEKAIKLEALVRREVLNRLKLTIEAEDYFLVFSSRTHNNVIHGSVWSPGWSYVFSNSGHETVIRTSPPLWSDFIIEQAAKGRWNSIRAEEENRQTIDDGDWVNVFLIRRHDGEYEVEYFGFLEFSGSLRYGAFPP